MRDRRQGLTDADFASLKSEAAEKFGAYVQSICEAKGWDPSKVCAHASGGAFQGCYCDCPNGPCQHEFGGWREFDDGRGGEQICKHCGMGVMSHDMRFMP